VDTRGVRYTFEYGSYAVNVSDAKGEGRVLVQSLGDATSLHLSDFRAAHGGEGEYLVGLTRLDSNCAPPRVLEPSNPDGLAAQLLSDTAPGSIFWLLV
jgi:hypothetical protein